MLLSRFKNANLHDYKNCELCLIMLSEKSRLLNLDILMYKSDLDFFNKISHMVEVRIMQFAAYSSTSAIVYV